MKPDKLRRIICWLMKNLTDTQFKGVENIPAEGGLLIATNHMSRIDIPVLFTIPNRKKMTALVTTKYLKYPLLRWFIVTAQGIWLDRDTADFGAFRQAVEKLNKGVAIGIAPEGTRSQTSQLLEGKPGTALIALRAHVPILPVAIMGTEIAVHEMTHFRRPHIVASFGKLIPAPELDRENRGAQLDNLTTEIMCQIAALMPEKYHGFYRDHPRLKQILAEQNMGTA